MAKHVPCLYSYHRAYNTYDLVLRYMGIDYYNSSIQPYMHDIVHRARGDLQHFRNYCNCIPPLSNMHVI